MKRFLVVLALVCFSSIAAQADSITLSPASQTLTVGGTATIDVSALVSCTCAEYITMVVTSGPDIGTTINDNFLSFGTTVSISESFVNNGSAGTDVILAKAVTSGSSNNSLTSNEVTVTWTPTAVPEPSSFLLLLTGFAGLAFLRRPRWA